MLLTAEAQPSAAGDQRRQTGAEIEQAMNVRARIEHVLKVIEYQEEVLLVELSNQPIEEWAVPIIADPEGLGQGLED